MNATQHSRFYRGDIGLLRACLMLAGFCAESESTIFNDDSKAVPKRQTRRLKLWWAETIFNAPQEQQWALKGFLEEAFGDRIIDMGFVPGYRGWAAQSPIDKSLIIKLRDDSVGQRAGVVQTGAGKGICLKA